jgi:hypothetical protein
MEVKVHIADETKGTDAMLLYSYGEYPIMTSRMCHMS